MRFLYPEYIYLMLLPAAFLIYLIATNKDILERIFDAHVLQRLRISGDSLGRKGHNTLLFIAFFFMTLALAEPVIDQGRVLVQSGGSDVVVAIDVSKSMHAKDFYPDRFDFARQKSRELIEALEGERIGLITFSSGSFIISPLTYDRSALLFLLERLDPSHVTARGTDLAAALEGAAKLLRKSRNKIVILVTDGGDDKRVDSLIEKAKNERMRVIVWMVATPQGAPVPGTKKPIISRANAALSELAEQTGGLFVTATLSQEDEKEIEKFIEQHRGKTTERVIEKRIELFYIPLGIALMILPFALYSIGASGRFTALLVPLLLIPTQSLKAGMFDFKWIEKGERAYRAGKYNRSIEAFEKLAIQSPKSEVWFDLGNSYYKSGRYKMALDAYERVITSDTRMEMSKLYNMANCYVRLGKLQKAAELYKKVLQMGEDEDARYNLGLVEKALRQQRMRASKGKKEEEGAQKKSRQESETHKGAQAKQGGAQKGRHASRKRELSPDEERKWMQLIERQPLKTKLYPLTPPQKSEDADAW